MSSSFDRVCHMCVCVFVFWSDVRADELRVSVTVPLPARLGHACSTSGLSPHGYQEVPRPAAGQVQPDTVSDGTIVRIIKQPLRQSSMINYTVSEDL